MSVSRLVVDTKSAIAEAIRSATVSDLWEGSFLPRGLPLLLGPVLGVPLAILIVHEQWPFVFGLSLLIPSLVCFNVYPFAAVILWMLLGAVVQETPNSAVRMAYWMIHRALPLAILGLTVLAGLLRIRKGRRQVSLGPAEVAMALFMGWAVLNILLYQPSPEAYLFLLYDRVFVPFCLYLLIRLLFSSETELKLLIPVTFIMVLVESIVGLASWLAPGMLPRAWLDYEGARTAGTLAYPHAYTTTLVFFCLLLFHAAMNRKPGWVRTTFLLAFGLGAFAILLSFSRGSWLGALVAGGGLLLLYPKAMIRVLVIILILVTLLGSTVFSDQMAFAVQRLGSESTARDRLVLWNAGLQMIEAKPLFGWGYGDYSQYAWEYMTRVYNYVARGGNTPGASHNSYIAVAAEMGLPALLLFAFPVLWWLIYTFKVWRHVPKRGLLSRPFLAILWLVILDHIVVNFFSDMRHSTYGMGMWWITLGLIASTVQLCLRPRDTIASQPIARGG